MTAGAVSAPLIIPIMHLQTHRAKNHINTTARVSIQSDTADVLIFYTLDGSKPVAARRGSAGSRRYTEPILLPAGRVAVRAVAVTSDGRESATVTKVFVVEHVDSNGKENKKNVLQQPSEGTSCYAEKSAASSLRLPGPRFLTSRLGPPSAAAAQTGSPGYSQSESSGLLKQLDRRQTSRVHRETDFLRCRQCLTFRPSDPFARFCPQCGAAVPPLPEQRLPPAEGGKAACCVFCNTVVPVNTRSCFICDASIHRQLRPQSSLSLQDHVMCVCCGSGNPAHVSCCLTCDSRLQQTLHAGNSAPSVPSAHGRMLSCSKCNRRNHRDARYCDWCGSKSHHTTSCVICWRCGASGHPYAVHCIACGVLLEAQAPPTTYGDITQPVESASPSTNQKMRLTTPTAEKNTQTIGLYYPSATALQKEHRALQVSRQQVTRNHQPILTAISPGRGYWRKQLDHVCAHLRSYAQNNAPFRALLGEPRLGRMVSAAVHEDPYEVTLTVSFKSAGQELKQVEPPEDGFGLIPGRTEMLSSFTEGSAGGSGLGQSQRRSLQDSWLPG